MRHPHAARRYPEPKRPKFTHESQLYLGLMLACVVGCIVLGVGWLNAENKLNRVKEEQRQRWDR